jgi:outer membrane murein-binding lipoprotein Lpp
MAVKKSGALGHHVPMVFPEYDIHDNGVAMETRIRYWLPAGVIALFLLAGCSDPGPAEQAGERIDEAVEETESSVSEAVEETEGSVEEAVQEAEDTIDPPGPAERAGRAIDEAAEEVRDRVEGTTDN